MVNLNRCNRSRNNLDDPPVRIYLLNKMKNANVFVFHIITRMHESKTWKNIYQESINVKWMVQNVI